MQTVRIDKKNTLMIAHRGVSKLERENTCAAFVAAGNRSYFGIETDIHVTADGQFVVFHDDSTQRLTETNWIVEEKTLSELRSLRMKDMDGNIRGDLVMPTLQEYIRICKKYEKAAVLEIKNLFRPEDIRSVVAIIREDEWLEQTIFISFALDNLICLRQLLPKQPLQYLVKTLTNETLDVLARYRLDLDIKYTGLTEAEQVAKVHALSRKVNVWTVDEAQAADHLIKMGVDYITSNILE